MLIPTDHLSKTGSYKMQIKSANLFQAVQTLNVPDVLYFLLQGEKPNAVPVLESLDAAAPTLLLTFVLEHSLAYKKREDFKKFRAIAELLWIHHAVTDSNQPYSPGEDYLRTQREQLQTNYPGVFDFNDPALCLCYAAYSALTNPTRENAEKGRILLNRMLQRLCRDRMGVLEVVVKELKRTEKGYFWSEYKSPLESDNFQCAFLRNILQDKGLLKTLNIKGESEEVFNANSAFRSKFREAVIDSLKAHIIRSSNIVETEYTF
jgi:hypothetical protein